MPIYQYPLNMRFKLMAMAPRIYVTDASGQEVLFVNQRIWKLKEDIQVYNNSKKDSVVYRIRADRVIDFSATYRFFDGDNTRTYGAVKRKGMRSIWRATYFSDDANGNTSHHLKEDNPWTKVWDNLLNEVPIVNFFTGYMFNPSYTVYRGSNRDDHSQPMMKLKKGKAFFESKYSIDLLEPNVSPDEEIQGLLSLIMLVQLERRRS